MKPKSKKDQYTVECENAEQTRDVLCYIYNDNDRDWCYWKYVTIVYNEKTEIEHENIHGYPLISFKEWKSLPDEEFTLPEKWSIELNKDTLEFCNNYRQKIDKKNIIWENDRLNGYMDHTGWWSELNEHEIITLEQFKEHDCAKKEIELKSIPVSELEEINPPFYKDGNLNFYKQKPITIGQLSNINTLKMEYNFSMSESLTEPKKIIGYKLIKPEYEEIAGKIAFSHIKYCSSFDFVKSKNGTLFTDGCIAHENLIKAGVMHWFQEVYESSTEQKIINYLSNKVKLTQEEAEDIVKLVNEK